MTPRHSFRRIGNLLTVVFAVCFHCGFQCCVAGATERPPNVLVILADDLGFSDLGCYGGEIATPNLDSLSRTGVQFTQFYNTGRCWPTRGALLTGHYAQSIRRDYLRGIPSGGGNRGKRPEWAKLLPKLLADSGYRSYHSGKWHVDGKPIEQGFDRSYWLKDQSRFFSPQVHYKDDVKLPAVKRDSEYYGTIAVADHAVESLAEHQAQHAGRPFFHYLAFAAPHFPLHALPEDIDLYRDKYKTGWDQLRRQRWNQMKALGILNSESVARPSSVERNIGPPYHFPDSLQTLGTDEVNRPVPWNQLTKTQQEFQAEKMAIHAAMVHRMDIEIGRVFDQIKSMDQWDNTIVMFLSDNGASAEIMVRADGHDRSAAPGSASSYLCLGPGWSTTCNTPFRRHKTWTHEGGISTPMLVSWPNKLSGGKRDRAPRHVIDVVPTILELAGQQPSESAPVLPGVSFARELNDEPSLESQNELRKLWWYHDGNRAVRVGNWKAVSSVGQPWALYDLSVDRTESIDLAIPRAEKLDKLVSVWEDQYQESGRLATSDHQDWKVQPHIDLASPSESASSTMKQAQLAALPKRRQVLLQGESFSVGGRAAFVMKPEKPVRKADGKAWIFYAPTLPAYPDQAESWMHKQFLDAGVAVAGIDIGEAYGSPHSLPHFDRFYLHMVNQGYSRTPALLGRSRGGLWVSRFAISYPDRVSGIGCIYPAFDYRTYPGTNRAAAVYGVSSEMLQSQQDQFNPVRRLAELADSGIPVTVLHGDVDKVVPFGPNTGQLQMAYRSKQREDLLDVIVADGQGHSFWEGYFHCQPLVDFLIESASVDTP